MFSSHASKPSPLPLVLMFSCLNKKHVHMSFQKKTCSHVLMSFKKPVLMFSCLFKKHVLMFLCLSKKPVLMFSCLFKKHVLMFLCLSKKPVLMFSCLSKKHVLMFLCLSKKPVLMFSCLSKKTCSYVLLSFQKKHVLMFFCLSKNHVLMSFQKGWGFTSSLSPPSPRSRLPSSPPSAQQPEPLYLALG